MKCILLFLITPMLLQASEMGFTSLNPLDAKDRCVISVLMTDGVVPGLDLGAPFSSSEKFNGGIGGKVHISFFYKNYQINELKQGDDFKSKTSQGEIIHSGYELITDRNFIDYLDAKSSKTHWRKFYILKGESNF